MDIVFIVSYSRNNLDVYNLSLRNHAEYCSRHGYVLQNIEEPYNKFVDTDRIREKLRQFDVVVILGTDVIIRRPEIAIETFVRPGISMCPQHGDGVLNGDFIIFTATADTYAVLARLDGIQYHTDHGQAALNYLYRCGMPGIHAVEYLQIAAPIMNPGVNYDGVDLDRYFSLHYHQMGIAPIPAAKAAAMRADAMSGLPDKEKTNMT